MKNDHFLKRALFPRKLTSLETLKWLFCEENPKIVFLETWKTILRTLGMGLFYEEIVGVFGR